MLLRGFELERTSLTPSTKPTEPQTRFLLLQRVPSPSVQGCQHHPTSNPSAQICTKLSLRTIRLSPDTIVLIRRTPSLLFYFVSTEVNPSLARSFFHRLGQIQSAHSRLPNSSWRLCKVKTQQPQPCKPPLSNWPQIPRSTMRPWEMRRRMPVYRHLVATTTVNILAHRLLSPPTFPHHTAPFHPKRRPIVFHPRRCHISNTSNQMLQDHRQDYRMERTDMGHTLRPTKIKTRGRHTKLRQQRHRAAW